MYKCKYCDKGFENPKSIGGHTNSCKNNPNRIIPFDNITKNDRIKINRKINSDVNVIEKRKKTFRCNHEKGVHINYKGISSDIIIEENRKIKLSEIAKNRHLGGYVKGSGRGKKGWYCGYWCDSSWELAWVVYNIEHNIIFQRNRNGFEYLFNGEIKRYYPDFIIGDTYYEIKGRRNYDELDGINKEKISQFKYKLEVLYTKDMSKYLDYVIKKYGKDYIKLYKEG